MIFDSQTYLKSSHLLLIMPCKKYYDICKNTDEWKVKRKEETKQYRDDNKELLAAKHKEYSAQKMTCECGAIVSIAKRAQHYRTKNHILLTQQS